jgi:hypothetical membrane protein
VKIAINVAGRKNLGMKYNTKVLHDDIAVKERDVLSASRRNLLFLSALLGIIAPVFFIVVFTIAGLLRPGYSPISQAASDLGRGTNNWIFNIDLRVFGLLTMLFAFGFFSFLRAHVGRGSAISSLVLLLLSGLGSIGGSFFAEFDPHNPDTAQSGLLHGASFLLLFIMLTITLLVVGFAFLRVRSLRGYGWYSLLTALVTIILNIVPMFIPAYLQVGGLMQRILEIETFAWYVVMGLLMITFIRSCQGSQAGLQLSEQN